MTTVSEAKRELAQIAERQAELQKIVDAAPKSLLTKPGAGSREVYWTIEAKFNTGGYKPFVLEANSIHPEVYAGGNVFTDCDTADAYADALDTLLMLRHQPGTEAVNYFSEQFMVTVDVNRVYAIGMYPDMRKITRISPCFATLDHAQAAIDTIGADRILRMFRTLHGVA